MTIRRIASKVAVHSFFGLLSALAITLSGIGSQAAPSRQSTSGRLEVVATVGDPAPADVGGTYSRFHSSSINDSGDVAFGADVAGGQTTSALLLRSAGGTRALLRSGDDAPGGGQFKTFGDLDLGAGGQLFFRAELSGTAAAEGLFLWTPQGIRAVARAGDKSPAGRFPELTYESFADPTIVIRTDAFGNPVVFLAALADMAGHRRALVVSTFSEPNLFVSLLTGEPFSSSEVINDIAISRLASFGDIGCVVQLRSASDIFKRPITVGSSYVFFLTDLREGMAVRGFGKLKRIFTPPAMYIQSPITLAEFKKNRKAILIQSHVLGATGDKARGVPGTRIQDFDLPVSNAGVFDPSRNFATPPRGVVSVVMLSDGRRALWINVVGDSMSESEELVRFDLIGGRSSDGEGPVLKEFAPIKLTDKGMLLLGGTVEAQGSSREGLFLLKEVFTLN